MTEERVLIGCDNLTQTLHELAKLQHSVQMASAIHLGRGPEASLRLGIRNLQDALKSREGDSEPEEASLSAGTEDNASHKSGDEKCTNCDMWFPWYALSLHKETCIGGTETRHRSSKIPPEASTSAGKGALRDIEPVEAPKIWTTEGANSSSAQRARNNSVGDDTVSSSPIRSYNRAAELDFRSYNPDPPDLLQ